MDADGGLGFADWVAGQRLSRQPCKRQRRAGGQALGFAGLLPLTFLPVPWPRGALERCLGQRRLGPDFSCRSCGRQRRTGRRGLGVAGWIAGQGVCAVLLVPSRPSSLPFPPLPFSRLPSPRGALERCVGQRITLGQGLGVAVLRVVADAVLGASAVRVAACASDGACHGACERIRLAWP